METKKIKHNKECSVFDDENPKLCSCGFGRQVLLETGDDVELFPYESRKYKNTTVVHPEFFEQEKRVKPKPFVKNKYHYSYYDEKGNYVIESE